MEKNGLPGIGRGEIFMQKSLKPGKRQWFMKNG